MVASVEHHPEQSRYLLVVDGDVVGELDYREHDGIRSMHHTGVRPAQQGHGFAALLTKQALLDARADGVRVEPICWYVAGYIDRNPEFAGLLAD